MKEYAVVCEGKGLRMFLRNNGIVNFSPEMLERAAQKRKEMEERKAAGENVWNAPKVSVLSVGSINDVINIGYGLWTPDCSRVDYALASVSRGETKGVSSPLEMYTLNEKGIYVKNDNNQTNAFGSFALTVLDPDNRTPVKDLELVFVRRASSSEFLSETWTFPGGYTEAGGRTRLDASYIKEETKKEIEEEGRVAPEEVRKLIPKALMQDRFDTALLYIAFANIGWQDMKDRTFEDDIDNRVHIRIEDLEHFVAEHNFDPQAEGALKEVVNTEMLIEELPRYR